MTSTSAVEERQTYDVPQAARLLGCSRNHLYELISRDELPGVIRLGRRRIVISKRAIDDLLEPAE